MICVVRGVEGSVGGWLVWGGGGERGCFLSPSAGGGGGGGGGVTTATTAGQNFDQLFSAV